MAKCVDFMSGTWGRLTHVALGLALITYGLAGYSYYYSRPLMTVSGTVNDHGQTVAVTGRHGWITSGATSSRSAAVAGTGSRSTSTMAPT